MLRTIERVSTHRLRAIVSVFIITSLGLFYMVKTLKHSIILCFRLYLGYNKCIFKFYTVENTLVKVLFYLWSSVGRSHGV